MNTNILRTTTPLQLFVQNWMNMTFFDIFDFENLRHSAVHSVCWSQNTGHIRILKKIQIACRSLNKVSFDWFFNGASEFSIIFTPPLLRHMTVILDLRANFLLVNYKFWKSTDCKNFQTQKGVKNNLPKTYPCMTLSYGTNNLAVLAVCKNFEFLQHLPQNQTLCSRQCAGGHIYFDSLVDVFYKCPMYEFTLVMFIFS